MLILRYGLMNTAVKSAGLVLFFGVSGNLFVVISSVEPDYHEGQDRKYDGAYKAKAEEVIVDRFPHNGEYQGHKIARKKQDYAYDRHYAFEFRSACFIRIIHNILAKATTQNVSTFTTPFFFFFSLLFFLWHNSFIRSIE